MYDVQERREGLILLGMIAASLSWLWFISPSSHEAYVFASYGTLVEDQFGGGMSGVFASWDLRPFIHRLFNDWLFVLSGQTLMGFKITTFCMVIGASAALSSLARPSKRSIWVFLLTCNVLLGGSYLMQSQSEMWAILLSMMALPLISSEKKGYVWGGLSILSLCAFFKYVTLFNTFQCLILGSLFKREDLGHWMRRVGIKYVIVLVSTFVAVNLIFPDEIPELMNMAQVQNGYGWVTHPEERSFLFAVFKASSHLWPFWPSVCLFVFLIFDRQLGKKRSLLWLNLVFGTIPLIAQGKFFIYHFLNYLPVMLHCFLLIPSLNWKRHAPKVCLTVAFLYGSLCFLKTSTPLSFELNELPPGMFAFYTQNYQHMVSKERDMEEVKHFADQHFVKEGSILYFDNGRLPYVLKRPSACRIYMPLSYERKHMRQGGAYKQELDQCVKDFVGDYIVFNYDWFDIEDPAPFIPYLHEQFRLIFKNSTYRLYGRREGP